MHDFKIDQYFEIVDRLQGLDSLGEISAQCGSIAETLGFDHYIFGSFFPQIGDIVSVDGFPPEWRQQYQNANYIDIDPTVLHCMVETSPLLWRDIKNEKSPSGKAASALMEEAASFGLCDGISMPVHGAGAEAGMISFVSNNRLCVNEVSMPLIRMVSQSLHEQLKHVTVGRKFTDNDLTGRESECLKWTAVGKTSWEISKILGVSESTVIFHLKNAIKKMGVSNRPQAVAKAVALAKIKLF
jgi:DNA-binding CsgD family transcriptional regulator